MAPWPDVIMKESGEGLSGSLEGGSSSGGVHTTSIRLPAMAHNKHPGYIQEHGGGNCFNNITLKETTGSRRPTAVNPPLSVY